jgi:hypothetical protein
MERNETKHTPGPWRECGHDRGGCACGVVWSESADVVVASAALQYEDVGATVPVSPEVIAANARLIAAAPTLLEALRDMRSFEYRRGDLIHQRSLGAKCKCAECIEQRAESAIALATSANLKEPQSP